MINVNAYIIIQGNNTIDYALFRIYFMINVNLY